MLEKAHQVTWALASSLASGTRTNNRTITTLVLKGSTSVDDGARTANFLGSINPSLGKPFRVLSTTFSHRSLARLVASSHALHKMNISSEKTSKVRKGSVLSQKYEGMREYKNMKVELNLAKTLGSLDSASLFILGEELEVNLDVLGLNALGLYSRTSASHTGFAEIKEMKRAGRIKTGKFNEDDEDAIMEQWKALIRLTGLKEEDLKKGAFAATKPGRYTDRSFLLKRQLIGFWLLQGLKDGDRRLPMEAYNRLPVLLYAGSFTKEEDEKILAWVEENGPKDWAKLARIMDRRYAGASSSVMHRYKELEGRLKGNRKGAFDIQETSCAIKEVLKQDPGAFEKPLDESGINFKAIASLIGRNNSRLWHFYAVSVHSTVMRYKAGTLEKDVRGDLVQEVKKNKNWIYSVDIEFDKLAAMPKFEGHNSISLLSLYAIMMGAVMTLSGQQSKREVTVEQVEEWWNTSKRKSKSKSLIEKEQVIINAYLEAKQELKTGFK